MTSKATGTSMNGKMVNVNKHIKAIPCDCKKCYHRVKKGTIEYCKYYDIFSPNKSKCVRYAGPNQGNKKKSKKKR